MELNRTKCKLLPFLNTSVAVASDRIAPKGLPHRQDRRQEVLCTCCARLQLADSEATCHGAERHTTPGHRAGEAKRGCGRRQACPAALPTAEKRLRPSPSSSQHNQYTFSPSTSHVWQSRACSTTPRSWAGGRSWTSLLKARYAAHNPTLSSSN